VPALVDMKRPLKLRIKVVRQPLFSASHQGLNIYVAYCASSDTISSPPDTRSAFFNLVLAFAKDVADESWYKF
jgi:hypothetical protein